MSDTPPRRRLAAILAADIAGFSRLMGEGEDRTLISLKERRALTDASIAAHHGRIFHTAGDSVIAEFASPVDAISAAVQFQKAIGALNSASAESDRMQFRVGLNLGDVMVEGDNLYGDGVNVAARIEATCVPGGITVSAKFYEEVRRKLALSFEPLGKQELKNIDEPVFTYRVNIDALLGASVRSDAVPDVSGAKPLAAPQATRLVEKPSILVLPFENMSGLPDQEFFADGLTEDILTELSRFPELFVISRNTSFNYKGRAVDLKEIGRDLNVKYVLEGSVRKAGNRVRITVQLIQVDSDRHLWSERYDRELEDIFAIQDEVTSTLVATIVGRLDDDVRARARRKTPENFDAYECLLEAKARYHKVNREDNALGMGFIQRAIELDPKYAHAHAKYAGLLSQQKNNGWCEDPDATLPAIFRELEIALALDGNDPDVHRIYAATALGLNDLDKALLHQNRALALNPNDDLIVAQQGELHTWLGEFEDAIYWVRKAMRLNPFFPERYWFYLARALLGARRYAETIDALQHISAPDALQLSMIAGCQAQLGRACATAPVGGDALQLRPNCTVEQPCLPALHFRHDADLAHFCASLRQTDLTEANQ